ncbi:hypothetical protein G3N95_06185 [Paraburkholderia sp. Tr-20389]|uniref:hypothetical protein n=1 Tax=Paraburkholderia sp. Tr-20389 TaxID=2703903 RepID=UPI00197E3E8D|nr:hypothetical protein [Paraburkholderia sp. Tr-20389]MBN3752521.1 hypothetical protein [Paraburkholderia sp. Tr-20389]
MLSFAWTVSVVAYDPAFRNLHSTMKLIDASVATVMPVDALTGTEIVPALSALFPFESLQVEFA